MSPRDDRTAPAGGNRESPPRNRVRPGPGQRSVWDFPRPPRLETAAGRIRVLYAREIIADTTKALRVLETSHPPVYYLPPGDVRHEWLREAVGRSYCEFKGWARYWDLVVGDRISRDAAWTYPDPTPEFTELRDHFAFHADRVDQASFGEEIAHPQPGGFYGGWITSDVVGPYKGEPGTDDW